jgi:hypothetical protein
VSETEIPATGELVDWATAELAQRGMNRTEAVWAKIRPWGRVARLATDAGVVWAKSNLGETGYEPALVRLLGTLVPAHVVVPLAIDAERAFSLSPDGGVTLRSQESGGFDPTVWERMLAEYAQLQRALEPHVADMLAVGTPDLRPDRLPAQFARLLGDPAIRAALGGRHEALVAEQPAYAQACEELAADGIAASLQHDDLHDNNVLVRDGRFAFFDWGDASVAHPFGTLLVALRVAAANAKVAAGDPLLVRLRDAYLEPWTDRHSRTDLRRWARQAVHVTAVSRSLSYQRALAAADERGRAEWGEGVHGWLEALLEPDVW